MPERPDLGAVVRIGGDLYECVGIGAGVTIHFERIGASPCPMCGDPQRKSYLLGAPNYESDVQPVVTVKK